MIFFPKIFKSTKQSVPKDIRLAYNNIRDDGQNKVIRVVPKHKLLPCYAPFNNMFFNSHGQITACCRSSVINDRYPGKTIKEIWSGKEFEKLRKPLRQNSFSEACDTCRHPLERRDFGNVMARVFDRNELNKKKYPSVLELELSNSCNLECIMCLGTLSSAIRKNRDNLSPLPMMYDKKFVNQLAEFIPHLTEIKLYGGEPFLMGIYYEILDLVAEINPQIRITITTNGTILNENIKKIFGKLKFNVNVSIDSTEKDNFEKIRKNAVFEVVMENLLWFRDQCRENNTIFCICTNPMRQNWQDIPELLKYFNELDVLVSFNTVYDPPHCALWNLDDFELKKIIDTLSRFELPVSTFVERHNGNKYKELMNQLSVWQNESFEKKMDSFKTVII